ncbi:MAG TPA: class I SAM-dependent methyltransferase [Mycobacteriales bacterium]|nr:class I SAM-dependent methyltransferase [Mycobacteriales bacterium]
MGEPSFFEAYDEALTPLIAANNLLQLVARAEDVGLLGALREPSPVAELAAQVGVDADTASTLCTALFAWGIVDEGEGGYRLTAPWRALTDDGAFVALGVAIAGGLVDGRLIRGGADTYWTMPSADRVAYARSISPNPYSDALVAAFRADMENDPTLAPMLDGGRLLELGCGVAGRILTTLRAAPKLHAIGVELTEDLAAVARKRAEDLGVADRFEVVCADATTFRADEPCDFGFWSQFFFPAATRPAALAVLMANLRSGAHMWAPLPAKHELIAADPRGEEARTHALHRIVLGSWGVPERSADELAAELADAGFVDVVVTDREGPKPTRVRARRP